MSGERATSFGDDGGDERDLRAGEYVLGVLDREAALQVEDEAARDPALQAAIDAWERRLAPLALAIAPALPPREVWTRLEAATAAPTLARRAERPSFWAALWQSATLWRWTTAGGLAAAAALAALLVLRPAPPATELVAALAPAGGTAPAFLATSRPDGAITISALTAVPVEPGRDLELWALPKGATRPISLGVLPAAGRQVPASDLTVSETQLLVTLEPAGGSPSGLPTGPLVFGGTLTLIR